MQYNLSPFSDFRMNISGLNSIENRLNFNRESKRNRFQIELAKDFPLFTHKIESGYMSLYDVSDIAPSDNPYTNKTGFYGYGLDFIPLDSLAVWSEARYMFRKEQERFQSNQINASEGYSYKYGARYGAELSSGLLSLNAHHEKLSLDREQARNTSGNLFYTHRSETYELRTNASFRNRWEELFILQLDRGYVKNDNLSSIQYTAGADISIDPSRDLMITFSEQYYQQKNRRTKDVVNDNADFNNRAELFMNYIIFQPLSLDTTIRHDYSIKDYSYTKSSNTTDIKSFDNRLVWEYSLGDSLITGYQIEMRRTSFPDEEFKRDKDVRKQTSRLGWAHYYKQRLKLNTWLVWNIEDDVSINALYSSNNKQINTLRFAPECKLLLGDRVLFAQNYAIRADYTGYIYASEQYRDNLYRHLSYRYSLLFDNYPYIARSQDPIWLRLPYSMPSSNAFSTELSFGFEQHDFGYKIDDYYSITSRNHKYTGQVTIKYDIEDVYVYLQPKYSWGTWKEYSAILGLAGHFSNDSFFEFTLNPVGEDMDSLDWRLSLNLSLQF